MLIIKSLFIVRIFIDVGRNLNITKDDKSLDTKPKSAFTTFVIPFLAYL